MTRAPAVIVSYSHEDEIWKDRLVSNLRALEFEGALDVWDDRRIGAGDEWRRQLERAIQRATVVILIVSKNFLKSRFIREEELTAMLAGHHEGRLRVIPLIAEPCAWQEVSALRRLQARPRDGRPLSAADMHQADQDLASLAVDIVKGEETVDLPAVNSAAANVVHRARKITPGIWLVVSLSGSGLLAALLTYAAWNWHVDTAVSLDIWTERLTFVTRGTRAQFLDMGAQFSRLVMEQCARATFDGLDLAPPPTLRTHPIALICRDSQAKITIESRAYAGPVLTSLPAVGSVPSMMLKTGTKTTLSVAGTANPVVTIEHFGQPFELDVPLDGDIDVVAELVDVDPASPDRASDLVRYKTTPIDGPRRVARLQSSDRGGVLIASLPGAGTRAFSGQEPISVESPTLNRETRDDFATTALVAPGRLSYVDYRTMKGLDIPKDNAIALDVMSQAQIRLLAIALPPSSDSGATRAAIHLTLEGNISSAQIGKGDPGQPKNVGAGRWTDPRLTVFDVVTHGWWKLAALAASWTVATVGSAYVGWKKLSL